MFAKNVGTVDRVARVGAGVVLVGLALAGTIGWWGFIGIVPIITGLAATCPAYSLLGIRTCPMKAA